MTAALQFPPMVVVPARRRRARTATVWSLEGRNRARASTVSEPARRRLVALASATVLAAVGLVLLAVVSRPAGAVGEPAGRQVVVTVQPGDTLWSIATRVAPDRDARAEVDDLIRLNAVSGALITPGQSLRVN